MTELTLERTLKPRDQGQQVRLVQEWLCLRGLGVRIDSDFGPATEFAVRQFQGKAGLPPSGSVDVPTYEALTQPMRSVLQPAAASGSDLGKLVVALALQHRKEIPREIGGQNCGPWVRLYMKGREGDAFPWCAGFVSFVLETACKQLGRNLPIDTSFSCDLLATSARSKRRFIPGGTNANVQQLGPGAIFLVRRTDSDWTHTGIVTDFGPGVFLTVEGNTNDTGSREGYEVCQRVRAFKDVDFIRI